MMSMLFLQLLNGLSPIKSCVRCKPITWHLTWFIHSKHDHRHYNTARSGHGLLFRQNGQDSVRFFLLLCFCTTLAVTIPICTLQWWHNLSASPQKLGNCPNAVTGEMSPYPTVVMDYYGPIYTSRNAVKILIHIVFYQIHDGSKMVIPDEHGK